MDRSQQNLIFTKKQLCAQGTLSGAVLCISVSGGGFSQMCLQRQPLCLLEAMKMMSEIPAPCDCEITAVLKENGALVSFGEPLFRYQPC